DESADLHHELLLDNHMNIVTGSRHPLVKRKGIRLRDLVGYSWILPSGGASARRSLEHSFRSRKLPLPRPTIETDSISFICSFLHATDYLSFLPHQLVTSEDHSGRLCALELDAERWTRPICATYRRRSTLSPLAEALLRQVRKVCAADG